jgi:hypothetical protein
MIQDQQLDSTQRQGLVELLEDHGDVWDQVFNKYHRDRNELRESILREFAGNEGCLPLLTEITELREKAQKAERALRSFGLALDSDGDLVTSDDAPESLTSYLEKRISHEIGARGDLATSFTQARLKLWTVPTTQAAEKIVEDLINLCK